MRHAVNPEYKMACRAPVRTCTELYGPATSVWVQASPQSELMGKGNAGAGFALAPGARAPYMYCVAIAVLMPFHSMTTTDSVQSISRGLAENPSEVLNPPSCQFITQSCR